MAKMETLRDDFGSGTINTTKWASLGTMPTIQSGRAAFEPDSASKSQIESIDFFDPIDSYISAEVIVPALAVVPQQVAAVMEMSLRVASSEFAVDGVIAKVYNTDTGGEKIQVDTNNYGGVFVISPYSRITHRWWRFRLTSTQFYFDTSPNGISWAQQGVLAHTLGSTPLLAKFSYYNQLPNVAYVDNVNVQPNAGNFLQFFI